MRAHRSPWEAPGLLVPFMAHPFSSVAVTFVSLSTRALMTQTGPSQACYCGHCSSPFSPATTLHTSVPWHIARGPVTRFAGTLTTGWGGSRRARAGFHCPGHSLANAQEAEVRKLVWAWSSPRLKANWNLRMQHPGLCQLVKMLHAWQGWSKKVIWAEVRAAGRVQSCWGGGWPELRRQTEQGTGLVCTLGTRAGWPCGRVWDPMADTHPDTCWCLYSKPRLQL